MKTGLIKTILENHPLVDYLASRGFHPASRSPGRLKYLCPLHSDSDPSFYVNTSVEFPYFHCYGCLEENERIWTSQGLKAIKDIVIKDSLVNHVGENDKIIAKEFKKSNSLLGISTLAFRKNPLKVTEDHDCLILRQNDLVESLPYIYKREKPPVGWSSIRFDNRLKRHKRSSRLVKARESLKWTRVQAKDVEVGDFIGFPVIADADRNSNSLKANIIRKYTSGPRVERIVELPVNEKACWLYGWYLAEGSFSGRNVKFSLSITEKDICEKIAKVSEELFPVKSVVIPRPDQNLCEVNISKVDLGEHLIHWFGKGCENKKIPFEALKWTRALQNIMLESYKQGDGCSRTGLCSTVSPFLSEGLFALSVQSGCNPSYTTRESYVGKDGVVHRKVYYIGFKKHESISGFHESIKNVNYYISQINKIEKYNGDFNVVDISIADKESFITKLGSVHNCKAHGDIINFVSLYDRCTIQQAIGRLLKGLDIKYDEMLNDFAVQISFYEKTRTVEEISLNLSLLFHAYLETTGFDPVEIQFAETIFKKIDPLIYAADIEQLQDVEQIIVTEGLPKRSNDFHDRREKEEMKRAAKISSGNLR